MKSVRPYTAATLPRREAHHPSIAAKADLADGRFIRVGVVRWLPYYPSRDIYLRQKAELFDYFSNVTASIVDLNFIDIQTGPHVGDIFNRSHICVNGTV